MPLIQTSRLQMWYERFEPTTPSDKAPIVLVCGFGMQSVLWPEELIDALCAGGHPVIIFDNRDVGLTERCSAYRAPNPIKIAARRLAGLRTEVPYTLDAMADDTVALMDALEIEQAHIAGMSMGGMITQLIAIRHPKRVLSICSWASMSGEIHELLVQPKILPGVFRRPNPDLEIRIQEGIAFWMQLGTKTWPGDATRMGEKLRAATERSSDITGVPRQFAAIVASPSRRKQLKNIKVPALIIHGTGDPMLPIRGGKATAAAIPRSRLVTIDDYGHNLPIPLMGRIADEILANIAGV